MVCECTDDRVENAGRHVEAACILEDRRRAERAAERAAETEHVRRTPEETDLRVNRVVFTEVFVAQRGLQAQVVRHRQVGFDEDRDDVLIVAKVAVAYEEVQVVVLGRLVVVVGQLVFPVLHARPQSR